MKSPATSVTEALGFELSPEQFNALFMYIFRAITNAQFRTYFQDGIKVKYELDKSGYILLNCKLYAYAYHCAKRDGTELPIRSEYGVSKADARKLRQLDLSHIDPKYPALTIKQFCAEINAFLSDSKTDNYIGKFTTKKHRFIMQSSMEGRVDISQREKAAALYALYRRYPEFENRTHFVNVGKAAIKDSGQSLIKEQTTQSRKRIVKNPDGTYSSVHVPYDTPGLQLEAASEPDTFVKDGLKALAKVEPYLTKRARRFLWIMSGQFDKRFSEHIGTDNSEWAERVQFTTYQAKVRRYFGLTDAQLHTFFNKVRRRARWEAR